MQTGAEYTDFLIYIFVVGTESDEKWSLTTLNPISAATGTILSNLSQTLAEKYLAFLPSFSQMNVCFRISALKIKSLFYFAI